MRVLLVLALLAAVVLFFLGLFSPGRSRRAERRIKRPIRRAERKSDDQAGRLGDWTNATLGWVRRALGKSARAGRRVRDRIGG